MWAGFVLGLLQAPLRLLGRQGVWPKSSWKPRGGQGTGRMDGAKCAACRRFCTLRTFVTKALCHVTAPKILKGLLVIRER